LRTFLDVLVGVLLDAFLDLEKPGSVASTVPIVPTAGTDELRPAATVPPTD